MKNEKPHGIPVLYHIAVSKHSALWLIHRGAETIMPKVCTAHPKAPPMHFSEGKWINLS